MKNKLCNQQVISLDKGYFTETNENKGIPNVKKGTKPKYENANNPEMKAYMLK